MRVLDHHEHLTQRKAPDSIDGPLMSLQTELATASMAP